MYILHIGVTLICRLVQLDSFPRLKYLTYGSCVKDFVLPYATRQLLAISSKSNLVQVTFDLRIDKTEGQLDTNMYRGIDNILSGEKFPVLKSVYLHMTIPFLLFPRLCKIGLLRALAKSFWLECVKTLS